MCGSGIEYYSKCYRAKSKAVQRAQRHLGGSPNFKQQALWFQGTANFSLIIQVHFAAIFVSQSRINYTLGQTIARHGIIVTTMRTTNYINHGLRYNTPST